MKSNWILAATLAMGMSVGSVEARVKLVALPERARVVVSLSNPQATLLEEERVLTLQRGVNNVDFSWRGVNIDPDSILVQILDDQEGVVLLSTSYPPEENALIWALSSPDAREQRVRISYLLSSLDRDLVYRAVANSDETSLTLRNYLRLRNQSGEDLESAEFGIGYGPTFTRNLQNEEVLEVLVEKIDNVTIQKVLTWDAASLPWDPEYENRTVGIPLSYVIQNDKASNLGAHTLLPGKARIFMATRESSGDGGESEGVAFTGEDWVQLTPVDRELKLFIGESREVKVVQRKTKDDKTNLRRNNSNQLILWDTDEVFQVEIENFKKTPVDLVLVEHMTGFWKMAETTHPFEKKDAFTIEYKLKLPAESTGDRKTTVTFNLTRLNVQGNEPAAY